MMNITNMQAGILKIKKYSCFALKFIVSDINYFVAVC